jgi:hypothetical protein
MIKKMAVLHCSFLLTFQEAPFTAEREGLFQLVEQIKS